MHNNFYFLRQVSKALESRLTGSVVSECFSQSKDELMLRFETRDRPFMIRASLLPDISCLSFPENFQRARKNSVDLLPEVIGRRVTGVTQFRNERSFALRLSDDLDILFKMHGNRTNVVLFQQGRVSGLFRNNLAADRNLSLASLDRDIDWSYAAYPEGAHNLRTAYFTFGKVVWKYLDDGGFFTKSREAQWESLQLLLRQLETPSYYITLIEEKPVLSLLKTGEIKQVFHDPLAAANEFYHFFTHRYAFTREKRSLLGALRARLVAGESYCEKTAGRLAEVKRDEQYRLWGDLVMANLHAIPPGSEKVVLENFYGDQQPVEIRLKKELTPQKNAEIFYRKAKNRHMEIERLESAIRMKEEELDRLRSKIAGVEAVADLRSLRAMSAEDRPEAQAAKAATVLPYREFIFRDYRIWVGRNAQSNDILTRDFGHKDDLWLHAKDVSGSHVLIKYQAGKNFPRDVVEFAASLAARNSRRKNETLCPVVVTPKKFVRKRKGDPPGMVVVEREEVVMVEPARSG